MILCEFAQQGENRVAWLDTSQQLHTLNKYNSSYEFIWKIIHSITTGHTTHSSVRQIANVTHLKQHINQTNSISQIKNLKYKPPLHPKHDVLAMISGVGLTHYNSLLTRTPKTAGLSQAEWFFKGNGSILKTHQQNLEIPNFALSACEEAELIMVYMIDKNSQPWRIGYSFGNECSDTKFGKLNRAYFQQAKLRPCAIAPVLFLDTPPQSVIVDINITRHHKTIWQARSQLGLAHMAFSLDEIETLLFQHIQFKLPGMVHYLFLGADRISYSDQINLQTNDRITINAPPLPFPLINQLSTDHLK